MTYNCKFYAVPAVRAGGAVSASSRLCQAFELVRLYVRHSYTR